MPVRWLGRGGGTFVHAPGQLAVYPLVPLERLGIGPLEFRRRLERAIVDVCHEFQIAADTDPHAPGVFCRLGQVAHVGLAIKRGVSCHGLFLNVHCDPAWFRLIHPDHRGASITTLAAERTRVTEMAPVREAVIRHVTARLGYTKWHTFTGHPLLTRTTRTIRRHA
jgi:lipoate-protein ligase B